MEESVAPRVHLRQAVARWLPQDLWTQYSLAGWRHSSHSRETLSLTYGPLGPAMLLSSVTLVASGLRLNAGVGGTAESSAELLLLPCTDLGS